MQKPENIDFTKIGFDYIQTPYNVRCHYKNGQWGELETSTDSHISIHVASTGLHYGQQAFEGLKAIRGVDGQVRVFRMDQNAKRLQRSAEYLMMAVPPVELFERAVTEAVSLNIHYVPPYGSGATLYIRPVLFGVGATVGVKPAAEYMLVVFVTPVGSYFKGGVQGINIMVDRQHDRAGVHGTGHVKAGGNYASSLLSGQLAHDRGYNNALYLDPVEHRYIEECGATNFFAIGDGAYVTPESSSILPSITNLTLQTLAQEELGLRVERRRIDFSAEIEGFQERGACGSAAVIAPIFSIFDPENDKKYNFGTEVGPVIKTLTTRYHEIQRGITPDPYNWTTIIPEK